jgi:hypothetical protein
MLKNCKKSLWICIAGLSLGATACKNLTKNKFRSGEAKTEYADANSSAANNIVEYNNVVIKLTDANYRYLKSVGNNLTEMEKYLQKPNNTYPFTPMTPIFISPTYFPNKARPENPPSALNSSDRNFFKDSIAALNDNFKKIQDTYKALKDYFDAQDYKDDKGEKGLTLIDSVYALGKKYYSVEGAVLDKLEAIADDAERITLKTHPLKEHIYALKDDSKAVADLIKLMEDNAENYTAAETKIKASYDALTALNEKHTAMSPPGETKYASKKIYFTQFNSYINNFLVTARRIMRDAAAKGKVSENDIKSLKSTQDMIRSTYNSFVD